MKRYECSGRHESGHVDPHGCRREAVSGMRVGERQTVWLFCGVEHTHPSAIPLDELIEALLGYPNEIVRLRRIKMSTSDVKIEKLPDALKKQLPSLMNSKMQNAESLPELIKKLAELQAAENSGRGISCVRSILTYLEHDDFAAAQTARMIDGDKTRSYPAVEQLLYRIFGCRLHGQHDCKTQHCMRA